jgi:hypothetical protein
MIEVINKNVTIIYGIFMNKVRQNGPRGLLKCLTPVNSGEVNSLSDTSTNSQFLKEFKEDLE